MARRYLLAGVLGAAILSAPYTAPLLAQQDQPAEDAGFLERQIQNLLGGEGRYVRVIGLQGVLSSEASIARIEIADDDGTWLIVRDIVLDWSRLALLRRRLEVEALTVAGVEVLRKPLPGPADAPALAAEEDPQPFALPELPVAVNVEQFSVGGLVIGEPVIGQPVSLSINGSARLAGGEGNVDIGIVRIDGISGRYSLQAGFDNESRNLLVDLDVDEDQGGLIASLSGMPGEPSLQLTVEGDAPINDFTATIDLVTDGIDRLDGTVSLSEEPAPEGSTAATRVIAADITGDVADLFVPEYRDFFGRSLSLDLLARQNPDTGIDVERLELDTQGMTLSGTVALSAAYLPERIDLNATIGNALGLPVILPVPGPQILVNGANLTVAYDEADGDNLDLTMNAENVMRSDGLMVNSINLNFDGSLEKSGGTTLESVGGDLTAAMEGFSTDDAALWDAVQDDLTLDARIDWTNGGPLDIAGLQLASGDDLTLTGEAQVTGLQTGTIAVSGDVDAEAGNLSRFSAISGQDLSGALTAALAASYDLSSGAFDVDLDGRGQDLSFGQSDADRLLEGDSRLQLQAARTTDGIAVDLLSLEADQIDLTGSAALDPNGFPTLVDVTGRLASEDGGPVRLPIPGPATDLQSADLTLSYDAASGDEFLAIVDAAGLTRADGIVVGAASLRSEGTLVRGDGLLPQSVDGTVSARLSDSSATDARLDAILSEGFAVDADLDADLADGTATLRSLTATSGDLSVTGSADATGLMSDDLGVTAQVQLDSGPLARFAALTGQDLSGRIAAQTEASYQTGSGFFTVDLDGNVTDLALGNAEIDPLLAGRADLALQASRDAGGIAVESLRLTSPIADVTAEVTLAPDYWPRKADVSAVLADRDGDPLPLPVPGQTLTLGNLDLELAYDAAQDDGFTGSLVALELTGPEGLAVGRTEIATEGQLQRGEGSAIEQLLAAIEARIVDATADDPALREAVAPGLRLSANVDARPGAGTASLRDLSLTSGALTASGSADVSGLNDEAPEARASLQLDSGPLARFATLTGQDLSGRVAAQTEASYSLADGYFSVDLDGTINDLALGRADIDPLLAGRADLSLNAARDDSGLSVNSLKLTSPVADVSGDIQLDPDYWPRRAVVSAKLANRDGSPLPVPGQQMTLGAADLDVQYDAATGDSFTASILASDLTGPQGLSVGRGAINADGKLQRGEGTAIEQLAAAITAEIANATASDPALRAAVAPGLQLTANVDVLPGAGTASLRDLALTSGDLSVTGSADATGLDQGQPAAAMNLAVATGALSRFSALAGQRLRGSLTADATAAYDTANGFFEVDLTADGNNLGAGIAQVDQLIGGASNIRLVASRNEGGLDLPQLTVTTPELSVRANGGMQSGGGTIDLSAELRNLGILVDGFPGAVSVNGQAINRGDVWGIDMALRGPGGTNARVNGDVLRPDGTLGLNATGSLPLGLANRIIAPRSVEGDLNFDLAVNGPPALESVTGQVRVAGARVADPATRLALEDLGATVSLANSQATLDIGGNLSSGGRITVTGPIGLTGNLPADIEIDLNRLKLVDPRLYEIDLGGNITVSGPLAGGAQIAGRIDIDRAEIKIPSAMGGASSIPDIQHIGEPSASLTTRIRAGLASRNGGDSAGGGGDAVAYPLDIVISAPREIFIRGRGLDAELGGQIEIGGTTANPQPTGELSLIRGRMDLLARRLEFTEATVSMQGDLVPDIRMVASSTSDSITAMIVVEGPITDPEITFESEPELPEDEVLAQLFFDKPLTDLTPLEVAQLASAISTLSGRGGGLFNRFREGLGVDDLNVSTDEEGNTEVSAGKYITENIYTDVTVGADGSTEIQLNYELSKDFDVRGSYDNNGNTGIGITFERDY